jgi:MoxR-like ATPase
MGKYGSCLCLVGGAVMAHQPVGLFGESGSGQTHFVRSLARMVGAPLGVVQFHADTDSASIVGSWEIDGNPDEICAIRTEAYALARKMIAVRHSLSLELASYMFTNNPDLDSICEIFTEIAESAPILRGENQSLGRLDAEISFEAKILSAPVGEFQQQTIRNFVFKKGTFLQMIRQDGWLLLDCVEHAPHELERLISLLEEDRTFTICELFWPYFSPILGRKMMKISFRISVVQQAL